MVDALLGYLWGHHILLLNSSALISQCHISSRAKHIFAYQSIYNHGDGHRPGQSILIMPVDLDDCLLIERIHPCLDMGQPNRMPVSWIWIPSLFCALYFFEDQYISGMEMQLFPLIITVI